MTQRIIFGVAGLFIVAMSAWLGWRWMHPAEKACAKSIALCKPSDAAKALVDCRNLLDDVGKRLGGSIERMTGHCMVDAESCNESLSCLSHADRRANEMKRR